MSIDIALVNLDRHEFVLPGDLDQRSEIRAIENVPGLFHLAMARLLASGEWPGCQIAIITDAGGPISPPPRLPSWETVMSRAHGWRNIAADVIADLVERHTDPLDRLFSGQRPQLIEALEKHMQDLRDTLHDLAIDREQFPEDDPTANNVEQMGVSRELEHATAVLERLKKLLEDREKAGR